jgi:hypothetical protein
LNHKVWAGFGILEKELVAGPLVSSPRRPIAACPGPRTRGNAARRGHRPPPHDGTVGRPPRLHAPCMRSPPREPYRTLLRSKGEANSIALTPRTRAILFFPAVLDGDHLLGASPLRSTSGLVFDFPSTAAPWGTSPASSSSPMSTTPTPHRSSSSNRVHRHREPTPVSFPPWKGPNWVPPPLELVPR